MTNIRICCISVSFATVLLLLGSCGEEKRENSPILRPVRYQQVFSTGGTRVREFSGSARAGVESELSFKVPGTANHVAVAVGDSVNPGDLIASLDPEDFELSAQEAEASLLQMEAQARKAAADYERVRGLYENRNASKNDLDAARAADESARAAVVSIEKRLELAQRQRGYCRLVAPVTGAIAAVPIEVNENVQAGQVIAILTSGSNIEVEVGIPEVLISDINEGDEVTVTLDALPGRGFTARVTEVGVASTGTIPTFQVVVRLDQTNLDIRPGMAAEVAFQFVSRDKRERFVVPSVAVGEDREGRFVYIVEPVEEGAGLVHRKIVSLGDLTADGLEIFEGLSDGDLLVTAGVSKITDKQRVRYQSEKEGH